MAYYDERMDDHAHGAPEKGALVGSIPPLFGWAGALISIGLIVGLALWGYKLVMRDVTGVPVVRALEGPMRVQPEDPGGKRALHQGLAVNEVQASGQTKPAADKLILAPEPIALIETDRPVAVALQAQQDVQEELASQPPAAPIEEMSEEEAIDEIAATLARQTAESLANSASNGNKVIPASVPGPAISLRPSPRPEEEVLSALVANAQTFTGAGGDAEVEQASLPLGTRLVQLGAFASPEDARATWAELETRFSEYFEGKARIVQETQSGGRTFFRLRAVGFEGLDDARGFCAVLQARGADCIPIALR